MADPTQFIGSKISLISKSEIRYEGILYALDIAEATISLAKVKSFGTENRPTQRPFPPRDEIYEFIIFRGADIKGIDVVEAPRQSPILNEEIPNDPAVVEISAPGARPPPSGIVLPNQVPPPFNNAAPSSSTAAFGGNNFGPNSPNYSNLVQPKPGYYNMQPPPSQQPQMQESHDHTENNLMRDSAPSSHSTPAFIDPEAHGRSSGGGGGGRREGYERREEERGGGGVSHRPPPPHSSQREMEGGMQRNSSSSSGGGGSRGGRGREGGYVQRGRGGMQGGQGRDGIYLHNGGGNGRGGFIQRGRGGPMQRGAGMGGFRGNRTQGILAAPSSAKVKFESDFDFEKANEELQIAFKAIKMNESQDGGSGDHDVSSENLEVSADEQENKEPQTYYKKDDFFDNISCEALEKSKGVSNRPDWRAERKLNAETFGLMGGRGGGGGRGYYYNNNRGRGGGYYNNRGGGGGYGGGGYGNNYHRGGYHQNSGRGNNGYYNNQQRNYGPSSSTSNGRGGGRGKNEGGGQGQERQVHAASS